MLREFVPEPAYSTTDDDTVYALLSRRAQKNPDDLIAQWQDDETRQWHDVTAGQMLARVRAVAKGLIGLGGYCLRWRFRPHADARTDS